MAHGVNRSHVIKLHQTLHGYAEGHRQLASSTQLKPRDLQTMLVLSDVSGPGAKIEEAGYLTGYPLADSKMYALARTWGAPELPRPGCVWTHTILIDFADLPRLVDPAALLELFRRPNVTNHGDYRAGLEIPALGQLAPLQLQSEAYARRLLATLYGKPRQRVIAPQRSTPENDSVVMAVWAQQWPRLRRTFRFSTFSAADRSSDVGVFDLQFLPSLDRKMWTRFPGAIEILDEVPDELWLHNAVSDLLRPNTAGLRGFLRRVGGDVSTGREAFRSLCHLHSLTKHFSTDPSSVNSAISVLETDFGHDQARTARSIVASAALERHSHLDTLDSAAIDFLIQHLELADTSSAEAGKSRLGYEVWRRDPARFQDLLAGSQVHRELAINTISAMETRELLAGLAEAPQLSSIILSARPDILTSPVVWRGDRVVPAYAFSIVREREDLKAATIDAMIAAGRDDLASAAVREVGSLEILRRVTRQHDLPGSNHSILTAWLRVALVDPTPLAGLLAEQNTWSWSLLSTIASLVPPDAVPNDFGADPWLLAVNATRRSRSDSPPVFLSAYLLSRALGNRSRNAGELTQFGFEQTYMAAQANQLPDDAWAVLQLRLPWSLNWFEWDRCARIRAGIADLFVERDLAPSLFANITRDDDLFIVIAETVARASQGRKFLRQVRRWMRGTDDIRYAWRIERIEYLLS